MSMLNNIWYPSLLIVLVVALFVVAYMWSRTFYFSDNNELDCIKRNLSGTNITCTSIWSDGKCRKASLDGNSCVSKASSGPMILMVCGGLLFIGALIWFAYIFYIKQHINDNRPKTPGL